ncbi:MAG: DUF2911 domain-containing protein [Bacteroidota bacterium]
MKKYFFAALTLLFVSSTNAQLELPRLSPKANVMQVIGYTTITIEYSRPSVHERKIWGGLVPYNTVWRTGANEATVIQFTTDVTLNSKKVPAGRYSLFTIPTEKDWTVILNKVDKQWGAFNYKEDQDLLRFAVTPTSTNFVESMLICFSDITANSVIINLSWEKIKISFKAEADVLSQAYLKIKEGIANAKPDDWQVFAASANFAADNNIYLDEALTWAERAISMGENYFAYFVKAKLLNKKGNYLDALRFIERTREAGSKDKNYEFFVTQVDILEREVKSKL